MQDFNSSINRQASVLSKLEHLSIEERSQVAVYCCGDFVSIYRHFIERETQE